MMTNDRTQDQGLDVPKSELMTQDEVNESAGDNNSLLTALGGGASDNEFMEDEPSTSSGSKFTPRTAIIAAIIVGGGGMIYGMRQYEINQGMKMGVFADESANIAAMTTSLLTEKEKLVLHQLRESAKPTVEAPDLGRNPVQLKGVKKPVDPKEPDDPGDDIEGLTREYTRLFETIVVTSIVPKGKVRVAVINKKAVIVGKIVGDYFEIIEIASDPETHNMYVKVKLVGFDPAVDGAELLLHLRSGG